ncbi:unnamed protein product [Bursaphelenchus okinawaensis]|uniref:Uncharacterized protein n=1 Tax=Bursaphelenchus okinawaensis TaxID=465554 RepID=A0A811KPK5_9BILA|nr:unnamed protein product [Bursaphelenchus okinawaensis]CAG9107388.1 unnamed protein product [Bursaphelenchus okinawaensis]
MMEDSPMLVLAPSPKICNSTLEAISLSTCSICMDRPLHILVLNIQRCATTGNHNGIDGTPEQAYHPQWDVDGALCAYAVTWIATT